MPVNDMNDHKHRLTEYYRQVNPTFAAPAETAVEIRREVAILGGEETLEIGPSWASPPDPEEHVARILEERRLSKNAIRAARETVARLEEGAPLNEQQLITLEEVILPGERPVVDVVAGSFRAPVYPFDFLDRSPYRDRLEAAMRSIGRIELPLDPLREFGGTGFFVGDGALLTNRHVALLLANGLGHPHSRTITYRTGAARLDLKKEVPAREAADEEPLLLEVTDVILIHPYWDAALLAVRPAGDRPLPSPLTLTSSPPPLLETRYVATVGYPQKNPLSNVKVQDQEFRGLYGRKRLLPGLLGKRSESERVAYAKYVPLNRPEVTALTHDCSTLTGNSGSAVVDLETGAVVGLHFAGEYLVTNYAVPAWELAADPYFRELGLSFEPAVSKEPADPPPAWLSNWNSYSVAAEPIPPIPPMTPISPTAWYEETDDAGIAAALREDPAGTAQKLHAVLPAAEADALIAELTVTRIGEPSTESVATEEAFISSLLGRRADPDLPEIVYLHGIMGGHLARVSGLGGRLWVNPLAFFAGDLAEKLALASDGVTDATIGQSLRPDGHVRLSYAKASRAWRRAGFAVNEFSYDWRKPIELLADSLYRYIEDLALQRPGKKFALVAHSMGGVVSALYAARHKEWEKRISGAVLVGSPLHGSYAPMLAVLGTYDLLHKLAFISRNDKVRDYQLMARTLSGLIDMLPDPEVFPNARSLFRANGWPDALIRPSDALLNESRLLKRKIAKSPLLPNAFLIVTQGRPTVGNLFGTKGTKGDGTVPARSAAAVLAPEVKGRYVATRGHGELLQEDGVIVAVEGLLREGKCSLPSLDLAALLADDSVTQEEASIGGEESVAAMAVDAAAVRDRFQAGAFTQDDWNWLLKDP